MYVHKEQNTTTTATKSNRWYKKQEEKKKSRKEVQNNLTLNFGGRSWIRKGQQFQERE